jgi:hypothetical protein
MANVSEAETLLDTPSRISCEVSNDSKPSTMAKESSETHEIVFDKHKQLRRDLIALSKRFSATCIAIILLVACLSIFSSFGTLGRWEQRGFNTLAILFTGIMSLGLGSLVGDLGFMLR